MIETRRGDNENVDQTLKLDIAIFAHNEERDLPNLLSDLCNQTLFDDQSIDFRLYLLANGCSDDTVNVARTEIAKLPPHIADRFVVEDRSQPGKSRTMNWFLRDRFRDDADLVMFVDGDIRLPQTGGMAHMVNEIRARSELFVFTSRPVKDVVGFDRLSQVHRRIPFRDAR